MKVSCQTIRPEVALVMGSQSDWSLMQHTADQLKALDICYEAKIISAHRTPNRLFEFAQTVQDQGFKLIIAGAGGAAHLPGMLAALTLLPVLGVPVPTQHLAGQDSLYSIVQMPAGVPVATLAIGRAGAVNAALLAAQILALSDTSLATRLAEWREKTSLAVANAPDLEA